MSRISRVFAKSRKEGRACFVAYLCAGDPDFATSLSACKTLIDSGIDVLELGVPFSDPLADGLTNQLAAQRALESEMTSQKVLDLVVAVRKYSDIPIVFYTYYNLVFSQGSEAYVTRAKEAGVDGLLTLDLPPEEAQEHLGICRKLGMDTIFIVAPTTPDDRLKLICNAASGFIYYVSREGVTGEQAAMAGDIKSRVDGIKAHTELPVVVGFGVSTAEHVRLISQAADGVVVGSSIVNCIAHNLSEPAAIISALEQKMLNLTFGEALFKKS